MARKEHPHALTLERFAAGKDGRANAFKKKKQGETRVAAVSQGTTMFTACVEVASSLPPRAGHPAHSRP